MIDLRIDDAFPRRALLALIAVELLFSLAYAIDGLAGQPVKTLHVWFDVNSEVAIPTWFSSTQLFVAAAVALILAVRRPPIVVPSRRLLLLAAAGLLFMSIDEGAALHERIGELLESSPFIPRFKGDHGVWISVYLVAVAIGIVVVWRPLVDTWRRRRAESALVVAGGAIFLLGAVVLEAISYEWLRDGTPGLLRLETGFEEFFEMFGVTLVLYALLRLTVRGATGDPPAP